MYTYRVIIHRVVDGDTVDCDIDLGFDHWLHNQRVRLFGIDAPETRTRDLEEKQRGIQAKAWLIEMLDVEPHQLRLHSDEYNRGKFGRILGTLLVETETSNWINVNEEMIRQGFAVPYSGGAR